MMPNSFFSSPKNKGGCPPLAVPPQTAAETRVLIAVEIVKTTPNATKLRHLQKLLMSQQQAEEHAEVQAAALRKNELLAEANALKRAEYRRRYELGQQKKAVSNEALRADTHVTTQLTAENNTLRETVASLRGELAGAQNESQRLTDERDTLIRERDDLQATAKNLQPQADALARVKGDVQAELGCLFNTDGTVQRLMAEFDSLKNGERTTESLERMKAVLVQLKTLQHAYRVGEGVI